MLRTGLVSVTFRKLPPAEIVALVRQAGLEGIEWGGDVHVPHGDVQRAREVLKLTEDAGLKVASYGSYYVVGDPTEALPFQAVLASAQALQAPTVRVWAGACGSQQAGADQWHQIIADARRIAAQAAEVGLTVAFEYHENTLTDTAASARRLLEEVNRPNVQTYWQPPVGLPAAACRQGLEAIRPWLSHLHVFYLAGEEKRPLAEGLEEWSHYLDLLKTLPGDRFCLIEFVRGDTPQQFLEDANTLRRLCASQEGSR